MAATNDKIVYWLNKSQEWEEMAPRVLRSMLPFSRWVFGLVIVCHCMACFWYAVGMLEETQPNNKIVHGWPSQWSQEPWTKETENTVPLSVRYSASFYYAGTNQATENAYTKYECYAAILMNVMYEVIVAHMVGTAAIMAMEGCSHDRNKRELVEEMDSLATRLRVPRSTRMGIRTYLEFDYSHKTLFNEEELLAELPVSAKGWIHAGRIYTYPSRVQDFPQVSPSCSVLPPLRVLPAQLAGHLHVEQK